jgi:5-methylcytosine-specific restriction endonuclease McrA
MLTWHQPTLKGGGMMQMQLTTPTPRNLDQYRALLLNADGRPMSVYPLETWPWEKAVQSVLNDTHSVLAEYDQVVRSPSISIRLPSVLMVKSYVNLDTPAAYTRFNVLLFHGFRCAYCGPRFAAKDLTFDHVHPRSRGGPSNWMNTVSACRICNQIKGARTPAEAKMPLRIKPSHPTKARLNSLGLRYMQEKESLHKDWVDYLYWDSDLEE